MDYIFLLSVLFFHFCFLFRKRLAEKLALHPRKKQQELPEPLKAETATYKILAFNAKDFGSTKELENMMELRLEQCLAGLSKQQGDLLALCGKKRRNEKAAGVKTRCRRHHSTSF